MRGFNKVIIIWWFSLRELFRKPQYWCSLILEVVVMYLNGSKMIGYANYLEEPLGVFDVFLYTVSDRYMVVILVLGCILLFSDIPFVNDMTRYVFIRMGKKEYIKGKILYIFSCSILYYIQGMIISILITGTNIFWGNAWSIPIYQMAKDFTLGNLYFKLQGYPYAILHVMRPYHAVVVNVILLWMYSTVLGVLLYGLSIKIRKVASYAIVSLLHTGGLVFLMYRNFYFLFSQSILEYHTIGELKNGPTIVYSLINYGMLILLISSLVETIGSMAYEE